MRPALLFTTCPLCMGNGCEDCDGGGDWEPATPEALAREFYIAYERLAPSHGYKTREASAVGWADVPADNKALMVATAAAVLKRLELPEPARPELREFRGVQAIKDAWDEGWDLVAAGQMGIEWVALMKRERR